MAPSRLRLGMPASTITDWELAEVHIPAMLCAALLCVLLLATKVFVLGRKLYLAPRAVADLQGPPSKHWLMGSYTKREMSGGKFTHRVLADIQQHGKVHGSVLLGRRPHIVVGDAKVVSRVLTQSLYPKVPSSLQFMRRHVGRGLLGEEGEAHRRQRRVAAPAFTQSAVNAMHGTIREKAQLLVNRMNRIMNAREEGNADGPGMVINCADHFNKMALDIIGSVGFGYEFNALYEDYRTPLDDAFAALMASMSTGTIYAALRTRFGDPVERIGRWLRFKEQVELDVAMRTVRNVSQALVARAKEQVLNEDAAATASAEEEERRRTRRRLSAGSGDATLRRSTSTTRRPSTDSSTATLGEARRRSDGGLTFESPRKSADLLTLMVRANLAKDLKPSQRLTDAELRSMVPAMLSAGHETASTALAWASYALIQPGHGQEVQRRLRAELQANPTAWQEDASTLSSLPYLDAVVRETLRLHSPIRGLRRLVPHDDILPLSAPITLANGNKTNELMVKKGTVLFFSLIALNTDDGVWGDGSVFRSERWLADSHEHFEAGRGPAPAQTNGVWSTLVSFGLGPTSCIGMRIALLEIKAGLAAMLSNFELLPPELPGEAPVEIDYLVQIVAHPVVKGREKEGTQVPVRIRRLPGKTDATSAPFL